MEPDLMEVGTTLEEAKALRREHEELLAKLNVSNRYNIFLNSVTAITAVIT